MTIDLTDARERDQSSSIPQLRAVHALDRALVELVAERVRAARALEPQDRAAAVADARLADLARRGRGELDVRDVRALLDAVHQVCTRGAEGVQS